MVQADGYRKRCPSEPCIVKVGLGGLTPARHFIGRGETISPLKEFLHVLINTLKNFKDKKTLILKLT
jgi:hypothetical protein